VRERVREGERERERECDVTKGTFAGLFVGTTSTMPVRPNVDQNLRSARDFWGRSQLKGPKLAKERAGRSHRGFGRAHVLEQCCRARLKRQAAARA
jgi:hypothetical protein